MHTAHLELHDYESAFIIFVFFYKYLEISHLVNLLKTLIW